MSKTLIVLLTLSLTAFLVGFTYFKTTQPKVSSVSEIPTSVYDLWFHWKVQNKKKYGDQEERRLQIFYQNYQKVIAHQADKTRTYEMGFTQFMDLTSEEFKMKYLITIVPSMSVETTTLSTDDLPESVDWRIKGAVNSIKNQAQCGSCWAFSTIASVEGRCFLDGLGLRSFSEQQLVDCTSAEGNQGCSGGLMTNAFDYLKKTCLAYENEYPYSAVDNSCKPVNGNVKITGYTTVSQSDVAQLAAAVAKQPIAIAVDANNWQFYASGVFNNCNKSLDHGVLLVGYTADAWIVRNSWGTSWGEQGYIRLARGDTCGIADMASYPTGCVKC